MTIQPSPGSEPHPIVAESKLSEDRTTALMWKVRVEAPFHAPPEPRFWFQPRAGVIANAHPRRVVLTAQLIDSQGVHMYHGVASAWSDDKGKTWQPLAPQPGLNRRDINSDLVEVPVDMTPMWHQKTGKLLLTGGTFLLSKKQRTHLPDGGSDTVYAVYDAEKDEWNPYRTLKMPDSPAFSYVRAGASQAVELPDGDILLPVYFDGGGNDGNHKATVVRCGFDGTTLYYIEHGTELSLAVQRGFVEPSLAKFGSKYYLTLRNDEGAYLATSDDGLHFGDAQPWRFDDDTPLGSCNTQQHWINHSDALFLAYTRNQADNDEVFRNRAPVFMARFDPVSERLIRATETVLLPKVGTSEFGNFGICHIDPNETWITAGRGNAQPGEPSIYIARITWSVPNQTSVDP